jgi:hypothetical protein
VSTDLVELWCTTRAPSASHKLGASNYFPKSCQPHTRVIASTQVKELYKNPT